MPPPTHRVLWPRHFMAAMPMAQCTSSPGIASPASGSDGGAGGSCGQLSEGVPCRQQGIVHPGTPVQRAIVGFFGGARFGAGEALSPVEQQQPPVRHSSPAQPHAAPAHAPADTAVAGRGTPKAVSKYATSVTPV
jgi:hypothetical protein